MRMEARPQMNENESGLTLTVQKAMSILDCLGRAREPLSAADISRLVQLPRSTVYRLLGTLASGQYVSPDPGNAQRFRLGFKIADLASSLLEGIELRQQALPFLTQLRDIAQEAVHLVVMDQGQVTYIDKVECPRAVRMHSAIGRRGYVHCTAVGKAMLASMPREEAEQILREEGLPSRTPNTITDLEALWRELERVRQLGYAVDDIENEDGIRCLGAAVLDHRGLPVAAISVSGPAFRMTKARVRELSGPVIATASAISQQMGHSL
jgi:IclR family KDG regulon transcriptional repressor